MTKKLTAFLVALLLLSPWVRGDFITSDLTAAAGGGQAFSDDFNRSNSTSLGANWVEDVNGFEILSNELAADGGSFSTNIARYATQTDTATHYVKVELEDLVNDEASLTIVLRAEGDVTSNPYYVAGFWNGGTTLGTGDLKCENYTDSSTFLENLGTQSISGIVDFDWLGARVTGTGASTVIDVWHWTSDPDSGAAVDISANWGTADLSCTTNPTAARDTGKYIGLRVFQRTPGDKETFDNFWGGDE